MKQWSSAEVGHSLMSSDLQRSEASVVRSVKMTPVYALSLL